MIRTLLNLNQKPYSIFSHNTSSGSGDTFVCVFNHEDEYYIMVAKNYFDASIDK